MRRLAAYASTLTVVTYVSALLLSVALLFTTGINLDLFHHQANLVVGAFLYETAVPFRINGLTGYFFTFLVYLACFTVAFRGNGGIVSSLRTLVNGNWKPRVPNWLTIMPLASSSLLLIVVLVTALTTAVGLPTGSLQENEPYKLLYGLAYAPIVEEITFRISTLGLLVAVRAAWQVYVSGNPASNPSDEGLIKPARLVILGLLFPDRAKAEAGLPNFNASGWSGIHRSEWTLLVITSIGFGLAHILAGSGWELGKAVSAALQGFAIGVAYLVYGAYASILFHWYFNVYFYVTSLSPTFFEDIVSLLVVATGLLGFALLLSEAIFGNQKFLRHASSNGLYPGPTNPVSSEA